MEKGLLSFFYPLLLSALVLNCHCQERKIYVAYMGERPQGLGDASLAATHTSFLENVLANSSSAKESLVYSYERSFNGFAARLTKEEAVRLSKMQGVVSVFPNYKLGLHTTRSWDFMHLPKDNNNIAAEGRVIVGVLDTGIWPEHKSFDDDGFGPAPSKWKGKCLGANFTCNNKLIGARYYKAAGTYGSIDIDSPRDTIGHGTHTASTAVGRDIEGASYFGIAEGMARGGVPGGRIAIYKVCWSDGCSSADILKAFDDAIADGVDIISLSLGTDFPQDYFQDPIAIGSFHAMKHGITTVASAGNSGDLPATVANYAPWLLTVAASTIDRKFISKVVLGNGQVLNGLSVNPFDLKGKSYPLISATDAANYSMGVNTEQAGTGFAPLNSEKVAGKIVFCDYISDGSHVMLANGVGAIVSDSTIDVSFTFPLPLTQISNENAMAVINYIQTTSYPTATILAGETIKDVMAPSVAYFSSRGPNPTSPDILKPDITAPGVDILAAWSPIAPPSTYPGDKRSVLYSIVSGTSMSAPHASGIAAYVKAAHPTWSSAAIKSAIMTSAYTMDADKHVDQEFAYGAGHVNPTAALSPGLIYDASEQDYVNFLCKQGYSAANLKLVTGDNNTCRNIKPGRAWDLNYPSFALYVEDHQPINATFTRTLTNVGSTNTTYNSSVYLWGAATSVNVTVHPSTLSFSDIREKKSFTVTVTGPKISQQPIMSGALVWENGNQKIRSPIVIYNYIPGSAMDFSLLSDIDEATQYIMEKNPFFRASAEYHKGRFAGRH